MRKDGDKQKGKSGPCTFSQRQGYINIDLKNGDTLNLSPAGDGNQYHDQHHNKVRRVSSGSRLRRVPVGGRQARDRHLHGQQLGRYNNGNNYGNNGMAVARPATAAGKERDDYQRGYRDGLAGRYDQNDHTQAYKDGVRDGECEARYGRGNDNNGQHNGGDHGNYTIENIGNGNFEVKWANQGCIADYDRHGNSTGYTNCNEDMKRRSDEIARHRVR